jgi:hypothetical protein
MVKAQGERGHVEACGACHREGQVPDYYTALVGCSDCREYAMFFEEVAAREESVS